MSKRNSEYPITRNSHKENEYLRAKNIYEHDLRIVESAYLSPEEQKKFNEAKKYFTFLVNLVETTELSDEQIDNIIAIFGAAHIFLDELGLSDEATVDLYYAKLNDAMGGYKHQIAKNEEQANITPEDPIKDCEQLLENIHAQVEILQANQSALGLKQNFIDQAKIEHAQLARDFNQAKEYATNLNEVYTQIRALNTKLNTQESTKNQEITPQLEYNKATLAITKLHTYLDFLQKNKKAAKLVDISLTGVTETINKLEQTLLASFESDDRELLVITIAQINGLTEKICTGAVHYEYELGRVQIAATATGVNALMARITNPKEAKIFRETMHRVDDVNYRNAIDPEVLAKTLELTYNYINKPNQENLEKLNIFIDTSELPADAHTKYYLKAFAISVICVTILAALIVTSIYCPEAVQLMAPVYQSLGHFVYGISGSLNALPTTAYSSVIAPIGNAAQTTAFVIPTASGSEAVPVWGLVAGTSALALTSLVGYKTIENLNNQEVVDDADNFDELDELDELDKIELKIKRSKDMVSHITRNEANSLSIEGYTEEEEDELEDEKRSHYQRLNEATTSSTLDEEKQESYRLFNIYVDALDEIESEIKLLNTHPLASSLASNLLQQLSKECLAIQNELYSSNKNKDSLSIIKQKVHALSSKVNPQKITYDNGILAISKLRSYLEFAQNNEKATKLIAMDLAKLEETINKYEDALKTYQENEELQKLPLLLIADLTKEVCTGAIHYEYELNAVQATAATTGVNAFMARITAPKAAKVFRETMHRVDDLKFRQAIDPEVLARTLELTNQYINDPNSENLNTLNDYIESNNLPPDAHAKYYLKALAISVICVAILAAVIVASIYWSPAAQLMDPIYQSLGHFVNGVSSSLNTVSAGAYSSVIAPTGNALQTTAFVIPGSQVDIPVWELVAGTSALAITSLAGYKTIEILGNKPTSNDITIFDDIVDSVDGDVTDSMEGNNRQEGAIENAAQPKQQRKLLRKESSGTEQRHRFSVFNKPRKYKPLSQEEPTPPESGTQNKTGTQNKPG